MIFFYSIFCIMFLLDKYWQYKFRNTTFDLPDINNDTLSNNFRNTSQSSLGSMEVVTKTALQTLYTPILVSLSQGTNFSFLLLSAIYGKR